MILRNNLIELDINEKETLTKTLFILKKLKNALAVDENKILNTGRCMNHDLSGLKGLLCDVKNTLEYVLLRTDSSDRVTENLIIFDQPMTEAQFKKVIPIKNNVVGWNTEVTFQFEDDDVSKFLDAMQESYCTKAQVIFWNGYNIDRTVHFKDLYTGNLSEELFIEKIKHKGYYTRAVVRTTHVKE